MILTERLFKMRCMVGATPQPPLVIHAANMDEADRIAILHYAEIPEHAGKEVRILSAAEIELSAL